MSKRLKVWLLELIDPNADGRFRIFRDQEKAQRAARYWAGTGDLDASACEWHGEGIKENYDAYLYGGVTVE